jgi:hypothetical protein
MPLTIFQIIWPHFNLSWPYFDVMLGYVYI